ncbi:hypothetical protein KKE78_02845 [Patescibacteria group bacterium]|nr:hypothetical protein [Patescibacteria group bacterium]
MLTVILKIIPALIFFGIFIFVVLQVPYPKSLTQASFYQIGIFFASLFLALMITFNLFFKNIFLSLSFSLGIIFLLILKALDSLNFITTSLTLLAIGLLFSYFKKAKKRGLTK